MKFEKSTKREEIDLTAADMESPNKDLICEYCPKTGHQKEEYWIVLATQNYCDRCQKEGHTMFKGCPKLRPFKSRSREKKPSSGEKTPLTSTAFSKAMKQDSAYHVTSAIRIHTSTGTKTGIMDSGSGVTLIKKELMEEIPQLEKPRP
jgi:hypothetical protein